MSGKYLIEKRYKTMAADIEKQHCGNCGRRVQPHQAKLTIKRRKRGDQVFHETWEGCYESTRYVDVIMTQDERRMQLLNYPYL
jgi:hypothetical protein